jgi:type II secretion system protein D
VNHLHLSLLKEGGLRPAALLLALLLVESGGLEAQEPPAPAQPPPQPAGEATGPAAPQPPGAAAAGAAAPAPGSLPEEIQLSFQGAEIDAIVKFLAQTTGKSVIKHKSVNVKVTILSPRKLPAREALRQLYRALALEGVSAVESRDVIMIVPEGTKIEAEFVDGSADGRLEGKMIMVKVFDLEHAQAAQLKDKLSPVLSEKAKLQIDELTNKIIITDHADNVQLAIDLIKQLDVAASLDSETAIVVLKNARAEDLATLLGAVFSGSAAPPAAPPTAPQAPGGPAARAATGPVRFLADKSANRLVITAPAGRMAEVKAFVESLDTPKPVDVAVRVLPLAHVNARDLVQEIAPMYQRLRGEAFKDLIEIAANSRSNSLIVLSSLANYEELRKLVSRLDTPEAQENAMQAFQLENADAEDVASQMTRLHQDDSSSYSRYFYYFDSRRQQEGKFRFVADRRRNTIIAIGPPGKMESVAAMIKALDAPIEGENLVPKIYPLKFVSAWDVEEVLNTLFLKRTRQRGYWYDDYMREEEQTNIGRLYGKVRIASEPYTNSIIVTSNSPENFAAVESILKQLDVPSPTGETTLNVPLNHAKAVTIANNINILFAQSGAPPRRQQPQQQGRQQGGRQQVDPNAVSISFEVEEEVQEESFFPWLGGQQEVSRSATGRTPRPVSDLIGKVRVVPDVRTNSLVITTNSYFFPQVLGLLEDLDIPTAEVLIEAKIIEVGRDDRLRLGVRWSPDGNRVFDTEDLENSVIGTGTASYSEVFAGTTLANAMRTGIVTGNISLDFLVQFLAKNTSSRVRAEPRINVADNERGKLFVGARVPFISGSLQTVEGGRNDTFTYRDVGIILEVTPHINRAGRVTLKIRVESSQIRKGELLFGGAIIDTRNYRTDLSVQSGQTVVLGGIIQREESEVERKVPLLGDIPLLGYLFKKRDSVERDVELMVFLQTTVTRSLEDVEKLLRDEQRKTPQIQRWEKRLKEEAADEEE